MKTTTREIRNDVEFDVCHKLARQAEKNRDAARGAKFDAERFAGISYRNLREAKGAKAKLAARADLAFAEAAIARETRTLRRWTFVNVARLELCEDWCRRRRILWDAWKASAA